MKVYVLNESGYLQSALGFSLSYNSTIDKAKELFPKFAFKGGGENKFLESIILWLDVTAPRYWWQEADTYRLSTRQSESTMHTLAKREFTQEDFEYVSESALVLVNKDRLNYLNKIITLKEFKSSLPEGYLQRRIWCMSYKTLQNIYNQRKNHRLDDWQIFCHDVLEQIEHPEFIRKEEEQSG